jgi:hypothetical protein
MTKTRKYRFALSETESLRGREIKNTLGRMKLPLQDMEIACSPFSASRVKA